MKREYKMTRQAVNKDWAEIQGAPAREMELYPPAGEDWSLHSCEQQPAQVVAVWVREKRDHEMSEIYSHSDANDPTAAQAPVKTVADMPQPK